MDFCATLASRAVANYHEDARSNCGVKSGCKHKTLERSVRGGEKLKGAPKNEKEAEAVNRVRDWMTIEERIVISAIFLPATSRCDLIWRG